MGSRNCASTMPLPWSRSSTRQNVCVAGTWKSSSPACGWRGGGCGASQKRVRSSSVLMRGSYREQVTGGVTGVGLTNASASRTLGALPRLNPFDDLQSGSRLALGGGQRDRCLQALRPAARPHSVENLQRRARFAPDIGQREGLRSARRLGAHDEIIPARSRDATRAGVQRPTVQKSPFGPFCWRRPKRCSGGDPCRSSACMSVSNSRASAT
jgi:hypothetical protein